MTFWAAYMTKCRKFQLLIAFFAATSTVTSISAFSIAPNVLISPPAASRAFVSSKRRVRSHELSMNGNIFEAFGNMLKNPFRKASASHILIKGGAEAQIKLEDLKLEIDDSPVKFAEAASEYSACPSGKSGGNLGEFGPGQMVKEFDKVVFNDAVGVVHGPIETQFGYHLILVNSRSD